MKAFTYYITAVLLWGITTQLIAQEVFNGDTLVVRFDGWAGGGFEPEATAGRIDSRSWIINGLTDGSMDFGDIKLGGDFGRGISAGRITTGGVYAFTPAAGVRLLGFQPTGTDLAPGYVTLRVKFPNHVDINGIVIDYDLWVYNDQDRSTLVEMEWSRDGVTFQPATGGGTFTPAAADIGPLWRNHSISGFLATNEIEGDSFLFIRWIMKDGAGSGSRDEWGLEEIRIYLDEDSTIGPPVTAQTVIAFNFDNDTDIPTQMTIDQFDARFGLVGAKRIGYLTGSPGRAANSNGWTQINSAWYLRFSTVGFSNIFVQSKQYSSPTGPKNFSLEWSSDSLSWKFLSTIEVGGMFVNIQPDRGIPLPEDAGNKPRLWLRWRLASGVSVGGGAISSTGTSRIDEISVTAIPTDPILPMFSSVQIDGIADQIVGMVALSTNGTSVVSAIDLRCTQVEGDSLLLNPLPVVVRSTIMFKTGPMPQPSSWNCMIHATSEAGTSTSSSYQVIIDPPPLPYAEKPSIQARNIQLIARTDSSMQIRWERGDGDFSMLAILPPGENSCQTDTSTTYVAQPNLNVTTTTRNGCKVVWSGTGNLAFVYGFSPLQNEKFTVLEFNGGPGRENYLESGQEHTSFQTRASVPEPIQNFRLQLVTDDRVILTWTPPNEGIVKVLIVNELLTSSAILDFLDKKSPSEGVLDSGCKTVPCTITRGDLIDKKIVALTVNGPSGHQSIQSQPFAFWEPSWPDPTIGRLLAEWDFDTQKNTPSWAVWEHQAIYVSLVGARDRGFATGFSGMASYADQWNEPSLSKSWEINLTTHGLASATVEFRVISSDSGPAKFKVVCEVVGTALTSNQVVSASATWALSVVQRVEIHPDCLNQPRVRLLITPDGNTAMNGNPIAISGTSLIDEIYILGKYVTGAAPLMGQLKVLTNSDGGLKLMSSWISAAGLIPSKQSINVVSALGTTETVFPLSGISDIYELKNLYPATPYLISHCGYLESGFSCSLPITVNTPYQIPVVPSIISQSLVGLDAVELFVSAASEDVLVLYTNNGSDTPTFVDSVAVDPKSITRFQVIPRQSSLEPIRIGGLRPGTTYRFWVVAVSGPDSLSRYSRYPHTFLDIAIPRLTEPILPEINITTTQREFRTNRFRTKIPENATILFTITPYEFLPTQPIDDETYVYGAIYSQGDLLGNHTYVVGDLQNGELRVDGLPLGKKWRLRVYSMNTLNGAVTYSKSFFEHIFETLPDPVAKPMSAKEVWTSAIGDTVRVFGRLLWKNNEQLVVQLQDGNVMISNISGIESSLKVNNTLALLAIKVHGAVNLFTHYVDESDELIVPKPYQLHPDTSSTFAMRQAQVIIGNLLKTDMLCDDGRQMYRQRGAKTRYVCLQNDKILPQKGSLVDEWVITGFPLYDQGSLVLKILINSEKDITAYIRPQSLLILPNKDQIITWTTANTTEIKFEWDFTAAIRPYDHFPDSVAADAYFITKTLDGRIVIDRLLQNGDHSLTMNARELHRLHIDADSLQLSVDLEWTVALFNKNDKKTRNMNLAEWIPFRLLRLKALNYTDVMDIPSAFKLDPARPNPFNPSTTFRVYIPSTDELDIRMYDILGRQVSIIHSGQITSGVHDVNTDAGRLSSGVYIIRAVYRGSVALQRVTLVK